MNIQNKWYFETITSDLMILHSIRNSIHFSQSAYQRVEIVDSVPFGRCLMLDGKIQSSESDEYLYHEALVHPAMSLHPNPKKIFIGGGAEGSTLREVLKHKSVDSVIMIDIDEKVVNLCKKFLPYHHSGAFQDSRLELHYQDARAFLNTTSDTFDVIILDLADPIESGPAFKLYTQDFYRLVQKRLRDDGILVTQSGPAGPYNYKECFTAICNTLGTVFTNVNPYSLFVPCFGTPWSFTVATQSEFPTMPSIPIIDNAIQKRVNHRLRYYDGLTHHHLFSLPKYLRDGLAKEIRIISDLHPIFVE